jgi:hypothetical protein
MRSNKFWTKFFLWAEGAILILAAVIAPPGYVPVQIWVLMVVVFIAAALTLFIGGDSPIGRRIQNHETNVVDKDKIVQVTRPARSEFPAPPNQRSQV